jgi:hypothetical protein
MDKFSSYIISESSERNLHMMHTEDVVLYRGVKGIRNAIETLRHVRDMLAGNSSGAVDLSVKVDGAPALFCGQDPADGQFFVAKKGLFNKEPKLYKTPSEIREDTSGDLADKLIIALNELSKLNIKGILQGDIMFTPPDKKTETVDGVKYITFQSNTIIYAVPLNTELGKTINSAKLGIVFHTSYSGSSIKTLTASYGANIGGLKKSKNVWVASADLHNLSGTATLTADETAAVTDALSKAGAIFQKISSSTLKELETNTAFAQTIETFNNSFVRRGERVSDSVTHVKKLIAYANNKFDAERAARKSEKGKSAVETRRDEYMKFFSPENTKNLALMFDLQTAIVDAKQIIIDKLNSLSKMKTFLRTKDGFRVTGEEGYVAIDRLRGGAFKLVDRMSFSYANFSPDILKAWQR